MPFRPDVQVRDVALGERDDVHAGEGEALEETRGVFLVPTETVQRFREDNVEPSIQRIPHQRLKAGAKQCGAGDRVIGELLHDRPAFTSCELPAHPELVRDRGVPLVVRGVSSVDGDLHCTVTSCGAALRAATSRSNHSRAAWRARMRTTTRNGSSRRSCAALRGVPRRVRRWRFARDRIITPLLPPSGRSVLAG